MTIAIHVWHDEIKLPFAKAAFSNGTDLAPSSQGVSICSYCLPFTMMQKVFLRGRHPAQLAGTHQSQACSLISKFLVQTSLKSRSVWNALFCFSGLEDESVFSWRMCYIAQFMTIQPDNIEDMNVGLLPQQENQEYRDCFCSSAQYQRWIQWEPRAAQYFNSPGEGALHMKFSPCNASFFQCFLLPATIGLLGCVLSQLFFIQIPAPFMHSEIWKTVLAVQDEKDTSWPIVWGH